MSSGYGARWVSAEELEAAARRAARAEIATLQAEAAALARQAAALRGLTGGWQTPIMTSAPGAASTSTELTSYAQRLRAGLGEARAGLDRQVSEAWAAAVRISLAGVSGPQRDRRSPATRGGSIPAPGSGTRQQAGAEVSKARQALSGHLSQCHPDDIERLQRMALALGPTDVVAARALQHSVAESVQRQRAAAHAAATRERLRVVAAGAGDAERPALLQLVDTTPDPGLAVLGERIAAAAAQADRVRAAAAVAEAATAALQEIGCEVGGDFATYLAGAGTAIAPMTRFPGYGLRIRLSPTTLETLVVRREGSDGVLAGAAQQAVCLHLDPAWDLLAGAGFQLDEQHRVPPGTEPVPVVSAGQWAGECPPAAAGRAGESATAAAQWQPAAEPAHRTLRHEH